MADHTMVTTVAYCMGFIVNVNLFDRNKRVFLESGIRYMVRDNQFLYWFIHVKGVYRISIRGVLIPKRVFQREVQ